MVPSVTRLVRSGTVSLSSPFPLPVSVPSPEPESVVEELLITEGSFMRVLGSFGGVSVVRPSRRWLGRVHGLHPSAEEQTNETVRKRIETGGT